MDADVRTPEFAAEAHRQSAAIAATEHEADDQAFVDAISLDWDAEVDPASADPEKADPKSADPEKAQ